MPAEKPVPKLMDARRSNKPIMEKRRRARINQCLNELKHLILEALRKDPSRHSKLEKADILEMTVRHLQNVQRQQMALAVASDPSVMSKFRSGFSECATEVSRYVSRIDGVDAGVRQRLMNHLGHCVGGLHNTNGNALNLSTTGNGTNTANLMGQFPPLHIGVSSHHLNVLPQVPFHLGDLNNNHSASATARLFSGLSFIPGRLVNAGDFALLVPNQPVNSNLMPMFSPSATSSTPSATITCHSDMNEDEDDEEEEEEDEEDDDVHDSTSGNSYHASAAAPLSPVSTASTCTSGSSAFSPPIREPSPEVKAPTEPSSDGSDLTDTQSAGTSSHEDSSQPSTSSADGDRMWRPW